jgi:hypothetical protein
MTRFNKSKYRKNLVGLSALELREALVREAELRFETEKALFELRDYIRKSRGMLLERLDFIFDGIQKRTNKQLVKPGRVL